MLVIIFIRNNNLILLEDNSLESSSIFKELSRCGIVFLGLGDKPTMSLGVAFLDLDNKLVESLA